MGAVVFGDDKYGVVDSEWLLIVRDDKTLKLHRYKDKNTQDYSKKNPDIVAKMNRYATSNLQTYQHMLSDNKQDYREITN